ncbi:hypothetical protein B0H13DRAFT_1912690 [Mycena leptocephala]|nr:hypothetical protein B0H13DRAFT_1912690 [Mycena leptocephala]
MINVDLRFPGTFGAPSRSRSRPQPNRRILHTTGANKESESESESEFKPRVGVEVGVEVGAGGGEQTYTTGVSKLAPASQIAEHAHSPDSCCGNLKYFKSGSESESWSGCEPELQWLEVGVFGAQARLGWCWWWWWWCLHQNSADIDVDITSNFFNASKTCQCQCEGGMRWDEIIRASSAPVYHPPRPSRSKKKTPQIKIRITLRG